MPFTEPAIWMTINMITMWLVAPTLVRQRWDELWLIRLGRLVFIFTAVMLFANFTWWLHASGLFDKPWRCWA